VTIFEIASLLGVVGIPGIALMLARQDRHRGAIDDKITAVAAKVDHIDECVDDLKERVLANSVTRADLAVHQVEIRQAMGEQRVSLDRADDGLHQRIMRLESRAISNGHSVK
jgi:hypothetical protein